MELLKHLSLPAVLLSGCLSAEPPLGIIGGQVAGNLSYAALILSSGEALTIELNTFAQDAVQINASGTQAIVGGGPNGASFNSLLYVVSYQGGGPLTIPITPFPANIIINSAAINASSQGIIGGRGTTNPYAAVVSPAGLATTVAPLPVAGSILGVAINDSGQGIIGGRDSTALVAYAAFVAPTGQASPNLLAPNPGIINSVDISASGVAIVGGKTAVGPGAPYAALISPQRILTPLLTGIASGEIKSVAINASNQGIIGGQNSAGPGYAAFVSPSGNLTPIATGLVAVGGFINGVAINDFGQAIIGGESGSGAAYAALVSPSGAVIPIGIGITNGEIDSVSINNFGQGLIGGQNVITSKAYAALVSPFGVATPITLLNTAVNILSVSMTRLPARIPTATLSGNSLKFASYINQYAPQDVFYFIPAMFDGTLKEALKSAAPTRNAISLYTASNNLFYLNNRLSDHLRDASRFRSRTPPSNPAATMTASLAEPMKPPPTAPGRPYTLWLDGIGARSEQEAQKQTVRFEPTTGAVILGFDAVINPKSWVGGGAAYSYTHVHEKHNAGHSNINQEYLFAYGSYEGSWFYTDGAVWGGLFQIKQVRHIRMTGFEFNAHSHPHGWQLTPHLELGTMYKDRVIMLNLFAMADWVNSWQNHYKEKSGGPMNAGQKEHYSSLLRTEIGVRFYQTISCRTWRLSFEEKGSYVYKQPFRVGQMHAFLVGSPGTFTVETLTAPQNLGVFEVGMIIEPTDLRYPYGTISYQGEFGSSFKSQQISLEIAWNF